MYNNYWYYFCITEHQGDEQCVARLLRHNNHDFQEQKIMHVLYSKSFSKIMSPKEQVNPPHHYGRNLRSKKRNLQSPFPRQILLNALYFLDDQDLDEDQRDEEF